MRKSELRYVGEGGEGTLCVFTPPSEVLPDDVPISCVAIPILNRSGGLMLAIPSNYLAPHALIDGALADESSMLGPSKEFSCTFLEEDETGGEYRLDAPGYFLAIDVTDSALPSLREYDPVTDPSEIIQAFIAEHPEAIADVKSCFDEVRTWVATMEDGSRTHFYSAREELSAPGPKRKTSPKRVTAAALAQTVTALATQVQKIAAQQDAMMKLQQAQSATPAIAPSIGNTGLGSRLPAVSQGLQMQPIGNLGQLAGIAGPPPKTKAPALGGSGVMVLPDTGETLENMELPEQSQVSKALLQQSAAITSLVAHLATNDPISDLQGGASSGLSLSTKGAARRERMQQELASGSSSFFMQVEQQLFRRLNPSRPMPKTDADLLGSGVTLTSYLEKFGGYRVRQDYGLLMWMLAHAFDAGAQGDNHMMREHLSLAICCLEQANLDGSWNLAYILSLLEEPPSQLFAVKPGQITALGRPFAPLIPSAWSAVALAYVKEMDLLSSRKQESKAKGGPPKPSTDAEAPPKSPPRRPKFPKHPNPKASPEATPKAD